MPGSELPEGDEFTIEWRTTLTHFKPVLLKCIEKTDDIFSGDDEMFFKMRFDETGGIGNWAHIADFDEGQTQGLKNRIPSVVFVHDFELNLIEDDWDGFVDSQWTGNDDFFEPLQINIEGFSNLEYMTITTQTIPTKPYSAMYAPEQGSGTYMIMYKLTHHKT